MLHNIRVLLSGMRILLPFAAFGIVIVVAVAVVDGLMDGDAATAIMRGAYRSSARTIGYAVAFSGMFVCTEFMRDYLRHASGSPLYHWPSTVMRAALRLGFVVAVLWCLGSLVGDALRGLWGLDWEAGKTVRAAMRSAAIGALVGVGAVVLEAMTMSRADSRADAG